MQPGFGLGQGLGLPAVLAGNRLGLWVFHRHFCQYLYEFDELLIHKHTCVARLMSDTVGLAM